MPPVAEKASRCGDRLSRRQPYAGARQTQSATRASIQQRFFSTSLLVEGGSAPPPPSAGPAAADTARPACASLHAHGIMNISTHNTPWGLRAWSNVRANVHSADHRPPRSPPRANESGRPAICGAHLCVIVLFNSIRHVVSLRRMPISPRQQHYVGTSSTARFCCEMQSDTKYT